MLLLWLGNEERYLRLIYLVEEATAQHVKRTISGLVKVECDLCINANTEIVVHVQFVVRQPFYMQSTARITLNINQPTIQKHGLRLLNLQTKGTNSRKPLRNQKSYRRRYKPCHKFRWDAKLLVERHPSQVHAINRCPCQSAECKLQARDWVDVCRFRSKSSQRFRLRQPPGCGTESNPFYWWD